MNNLKSQSAYLIIIFINLLFAYKYGQRVFDYTGYFLPFLLIFYIGLYLFIKKVKLSFRTYFISNYLVLFLFILVSIFIFKYLPVAKLNVDRWSVITSFLDAFLKGDYPYLAKSHLGNFPGPMPVYFAIALPFYWLGELGYLSLAGIVFMVLINEIYVKNENDKLWSTLLLVSSPFYLWEVVTRSNILINAVLIVIYMIFL